MGGNVDVGSIMGASEQTAEMIANIFKSYNEKKEDINLANTAHQREVADLRAAGLNPILSATGGRGAASPDMSSPPIHSDVGNILANSSSKVAETKMAETAALKQASEAKLNTALAAKTEAETSDITSGRGWAEAGLASAQQSAVFKDIELKDWQIKKIKTDNELSQEQISRFQLEMPKLQSQYLLYKKGNPTNVLGFFDWIQKFIPFVGQGSSYFPQTK